MIRKPLTLLILDDLEGNHNSAYWRAIVVLGRHTSCMSSCILDTPLLATQQTTRLVYWHTYRDRLHETIVTDAGCCHWYDQRQRLTSQVSGVYTSVMMLKKFETLKLRLRRN